MQGKASMLVVCLAAVVSCLCSWVAAYELKVTIEDKKFEGPLKDPEWVEKQWGSLDEWKKGEAVVYLNDNNFEHLTQAASGWTTGDWFVMFGAPWCAYCKDMEENWNQTARDLFGEVNVAYIDASTNPFSSKRFNVTKYPTLLLLHKGRMFEYTGDRYWRNMIVFARIGYEAVASFEIPPAHGTFDELVLRLQRWSGEVYELFEYHPSIFFGSIVFGIMFGCMLPYGYVLMAKMDPSFVDMKQGTPGAKVWQPNNKQTSAPLEPIHEIEEELINPSDLDQKVSSKQANSEHSGTEKEEDGAVEVVTDPSSSAKAKSRKSKGKKKQ